VTNDENERQPEFFTLDEIEPWRAEWKDMPEFTQQDLTPWKSMLVHFESPGDLARFAVLVEQTLSPRTRSIWFPAAEIGRYANKRYISYEP
jgi:hypothetical protein